MHLEGEGGGGLGGGEGLGPRKVVVERDSGVNFGVG